MKLTGLQIAAAITLSGLTREALANEAHVGRNTIDRIINETAACREDTIRKITDILEVRGIEFLPGEGVRRKPLDIEIFEGTERFDEFYDFLYQHLLMNGGDVCIYAVDENLFAKYRGDPELHRQRMKELVDGGKVTCRILAAKSRFKSEYAQFKRLPQNLPSFSSFYVFGNCFALISFLHEPAPYVVLHKSGPFAETYKQTFNLLWETAENT